MSSDVLSLHEFEELMGDHWVDCLNKVNPAYRGCVVEKVNKVGDECYWTAAGLAESSAGILDLVGLDGYELVSDCLKRVAESSENSAQRLIWMSEEFLEEVIKVDEDYVPLVFEGVRRVAEIDGETAFDLTNNSLSVLYVEEGEWYQLFQDSVSGLVEKDAEAASRLSVNFSAILHRLIKVDKEYVPMVFDSFEEVSEVDAVVGERLAWYSADILDRVGLDGFYEIVGGLKKIAEKDKNYARGLIERTVDLLEDYDANEELSGDIFLVSSIRNQKDFNSIKRVVDSENINVKKAYGEVGGSFY